MVFLSQEDLYDQLQANGAHNMSRIKCYRFQCELCQKEASIQVFYKKNGEAGYARARHLGEDKKFYYHQQSLEYINRKLGELHVDLGQESNDKSIDHNKPNLSSKLVLGVRLPGFEPGYSAWEACTATSTSTIL